MAKKNDLPKTAQTETDNGASSSITYATEVVAIIAGIAANEVEGIAGMCNVSGGILGRNKNITKGVKVEVGTEEVSCDLYVTMEYGRPIQKVAQEAQESVRKAIEAMTGLHVVRVDVHVQGVSFEKENDAITAGAKKAALTGETAAMAETKSPEPKAEEKAAEKEPEEQPAPAEEKKEEPAPAPVEEPAPVKEE